MKIKVTALISDDLIQDVIFFVGGGDTISECLISALEEWVSIKNLTMLSREIKKKPIEFKKGYTANKVRALSRRKRV